MKYAGIIKNDISAGQGVCVSVFVQGCARHCPGCHNQDTWDFNGGKEFTNEVLMEIIDAITANGIERNFCIMGGEPLCQENMFLTCLLVQTIRDKFPNIKIYVWTGDTYENLINNKRDGKLDIIFSKADYLIDGPYIQEERDITLPLRGSRNQRVIDLKEKGASE